jgi:hypothetical protein
MAWPWNVSGKISPLALLYVPGSRWIRLAGACVEAAEACVMVFHAVAGLVPDAASFPLTLSTQKSVA